MNISSELFTIAPLAVAHRDWMKSKAMGAYFECNFDDTNLDSGHAYAVTVSMCIGSTQDKAGRSRRALIWSSVRRKAGRAMRNPNTASSISAIDD